MGMVSYPELVQTVLSVQEQRAPLSASGVDDDSEPYRSLCNSERGLRDQMEATPEHRARQDLWVACARGGDRSMVMTGGEPMTGDAA